MIAAGRRLTAAPQLAVPNGDKLRFRLVGDEPIARPDGQSVVAGWKVLVFQDMKSGRCYATFVHGAGESVAGEIACAAPPELEERIYTVRDRSGWRATTAVARVSSGPYEDAATPPASRSRSCAPAIPPVATMAAHSHTAWRNLRSI